ncbi:MAG: hypothetical protein AB7O98_02695 [Hyphomonadaceae bacterium]
MKGLRRSDDRSRRPRLGALAGALLAVFLQAFVVQTHVHAFAPVNASFEQSGAAHIDDVHVSATHQASCIVCDVLAASSRAALPEAPNFLCVAGVAFESAAPVLPRAPPAPALPWQSRAPPIAV